MMHIADRESALVDFDALELDPSADRYGELLGKVTDLVKLVSDRCSLSLLESYDTVLLRLVALAEPQARWEASRRLAVLRRVPAGIIRTLALDEIEIAQPILIRSVALSDDDLIAISEIRGIRHRRAIAMRPDLSETVTSVLLEQSDDSVRRTLAGNCTAQFSHGGYERLLTQAEQDAEMQQLIAARYGVPDWVKAEMKRIAGHEIGQKIDQAAAARQARRVARAAAAGEWTLRVEAMFGGYDFSVAERLMRESDGSALSDLETIAAMAGEDRFAEVAVGLAKLSGLELHKVLGWFANRDIEMVLTVLRAHDATEAQCRSVINVGPWRHFVTGEDRQKALERFGQLDREQARASVEMIRRADAA